MKTKVPNLKIRSNQSKAKKHFFKVLDKFFNFETHELAHSKKRKNLFIAYNCLLTLQYVPLLWFCDTEIQGWEDYYQIYQIAEFLRLDQTLMKIGGLKIVSLLLAFGTSMLGLLFGFLVYKSYSKKKIPLYLSLVVKWFLFDLSELMMVPFSVLFISLVKFSLFNYEAMREYQNQPSTQLDNGFLGLVGVPAFLVVACANYLRFTLNYDIRHYYSEETYNSRAFSKLEVQNLYFRLSAILLYSFLGTYHEVAYRSFVMVMSVIFFLKYLVFGPYYNQIANTINGTHFLVLFWVSASLQLGILTESSLLPVFSTTFILPVLIVLQVHYFKHIQIPQAVEVSNSYQLNQKFRYLISTSDPELLLKYFSRLKKQLKTDDKKYLSIWETNYCIDYLEDNRLARVKLSRSIQTKGNLETEFMTHKCKKRLKELAQTEDLTYLKFQTKFQKAKTQDQTLCFILLDLINEIQSPKPQKKKIEFLLEKSYSVVQKLNCDYEKLMKINGYCSEALHLYSTYLSEILQETQKSERLDLLKRRIRTKKKKDDTLVSYFDESNAVMVVSGDPSDFGTVSFANKKAANLLSISIENLRGSQLSDFIPYPFNLNHNKAMLDFIENCTTSKIELPVMLFLRNTKGYLVECSIIVTCSAVENYPFFVVLLKERSSTRQLALIDGDGLILGHSNLLPALLCSSQNDLRNYNLQEIVPQFSLELQPYKPIFFNAGESIIAFVITFKVIKKVTHTVVLFMTDRKEIHRWIKGIEADYSEYHSFKSFVWSKSKSNSVKSIEKEGEIQIKLSQEFITLRQNQEESNQESISLKKKGTKTSEVTNLTNNSNINSVNMKKRIRRSLKSEIRNLAIAVFLGILAISGVSSVLVWYNLKEVENARSTDNLIALGELLNSFVTISDSTRKINISEGFDTQEEVTRLEQQLVILEGIHSTFNEMIEQWRDCKIDSYLLEKTIPVYRAETEGFENLLDAIHQISSSVRKVMLNEDSLENERFIVKNALGKVLSYSEICFEELVTCKREYIQSLSNRLLLVIIGIDSLICGIFLLWVVLVLRINSFFVRIWNNVMNKALNTFFEKKNRLTNRIENIHNNTHSDYNRRTKPRGEVTFGEKWKFIRVLGIFLLMSLLFNTLCSIWVEGTAGSTIMKNSKLLEKLMRDRYLTKELNFWTRESAMDTTSRNLYSFITQNTVFSSPVYEFERVYKDIKKSNSDYLVLFLTEETNKAFEQKFFNSLDSQVNFLKHGILKGINLLLEDSSSYVRSSQVPQKTLTQLNTQIYTLEKDLEKLISSLYRSFNTELDSQVTLLIWVTVVWGSLVFLIYFLVFIPFISNEKKLIKRISSISDTVLR